MHYRYQELLRGWEEATMGSYKANPIPARVQSLAHATSSLLALPEALPIVCLNMHHVRQAATAATSATPSIVPG